MEHLRHFECDTPDCIHCQEGTCGYQGPLALQEHRCTNFERRMSQTVIIVVERGLVSSVYASPDLKDAYLEILDMDAQEEQERNRIRLNVIKDNYSNIY